jgi:hypothetical protein
MPMIPAAASRETSHGRNEKTAFMLGARSQMIEERVS